MPRVAVAEGGLHGVVTHRHHRLRCRRRACRRQSPPDRAVLGPRPRVNRPTSARSGCRKLAPSSKATSRQARLLVQRECGRRGGGPWPEFIEGLRNTRKRPRRQVSDFTRGATAAAAPAVRAGSRDPECAGPPRTGHAPTLPPSDHVIAGPFGRLPLDALAGVRPVQRAALGGRRPWRGKRVRPARCAPAAWTWWAWSWWPPACGGRRRPPRRSRAAAAARRWCWWCSWAVSPHSSHGWG
jgi:hypothetical protein